MIIAVDFDGTIVEHKYPKIGKEIPFAVETLKRLQADHHTLILWSVREGQLLKDAVDWCRGRGLEFYAVNSNHPEDFYEGEDTPTSPPQTESRPLHRRPQPGRTSRLGRDLPRDHRRNNLPRLLPLPLNLALPHPPQVPLALVREIVPAHRTG